MGWEGREHPAGRTCPRWIIERAGSCRSRALPPYVVLVAHWSAASRSLRTGITLASDAVDSSGDASAALFQKL